MSPEILIKRPHYEELLLKNVGTSKVKVLTGIRRCGKSSLLKMLVSQMVEKGFPQENIFYRRFDKFGMPVNPDADWLLGQLKEAMAKAKVGYDFRVFLDEIQEVAQWEKVVRQLHSRENTDVFITGSNAYILSSDLSTFLSGRYKKIEIYPLSFKEYVEFSRELIYKNLEIDSLFQDYLKFGGMPELFEFNKSDEAVREVLEDTFDSIIMNDVTRRARIADVDLLMKLVRYLFSTSGSLFSTKKIVDALVSSGRKVKSETVDSYLKTLIAAFALCECEQRGLSGKKILRPFRKFYPADIGFRNLVTRFTGQHLGFQLDNVVYMELKRRGCDVYVGSLGDSEIDFVALKNEETTYFQVTTSLLEESVFTREIEPLRKVNDNFEKTILTLDGWGSGVTEDGITIMKIQDWLLNKS